MKWYKTLKQKIFLSFEKMSFYITLPSSVKLSGVEDKNTNFHYFTRLARLLNIEGDEWEVGLSEISYPLSVENVGSGEILIRGRTRSRFMSFSIEPGQYISNYEIVEELEERMKKMFTSTPLVETEKDKFYLRTMDRVPDIQFDYSSSSNEFSITLGEQLAIKIRGELADVMGFPRDTWMSTGRHVSSFNPNLFGRNSLFYVYASFASPRFVGDVKVPLLRVFPAEEGSRKKIAYKQFKQIQYVPVENLSTELVEIDIRRDDGTSPPFCGGRVVLTVHFRKKN